MIDRELKKLSRSDLLELLIAQSKENDQLRAKLAQAEQQLQSRAIALENAGSIAEASLRLTGVFQAAQDAAAMYLDNIQNLSARQEEICARVDAESRQEAQRRLTETEEKCRALEAETQEKCEKMSAETRERCEKMTAEAQARNQELTAAARQEADGYWEEVQMKMEQFCAHREGLQEMLSAYARKDNR